MKLATLLNHVKNVPWMTEQQAEEIYSFIINTKPKNILELGFAHGKSTVVMAAALDELGDGFIDTIDLEVVKAIFSNPSIEELLSRTGLERYVAVHREQHSYNWWLRKKLETQLINGCYETIYDFCFLDGAHNFTVDTCAFTLANRLMNPKGTLLLDDLQYSYEAMNRSHGNSNALPPMFIDDWDPRSRVAKTRMSDDELKDCHVGTIYRLLIKTDPDYTDFRTSQNGDWGWATKRRT